MAHCGHFLCHVGEIGLKTLDSRVTMSNALQLSLFLLWPQGSSFEPAEFKRRNANAVGDSNAAQQTVGPERRKRVSEDEWCGEGWVKSRRLVNSDVMCYLVQL